MEKKPTIKCKTQLLYLNLREHMDKYADLLKLCINSSHKYEVVSNDIEKNSIGEPFVLFQYFDKIDEPESQRDKFNVFAQCININTLENYDQIVEGHIAEELQLIYDENYSNKEGVFYKIIIYIIKTNVQGVVDVKRETERIKPASKTGK